jgi:hypothetical protein
LSKGRITSLGKISYSLSSLLVREGFPSFCVIVERQAKDFPSFRISANTDSNDFHFGSIYALGRQVLPGHSPIIERVILTA